MARAHHSLQHVNRTFVQLPPPLPLPRVRLHPRLHLLLLLIALVATAAVCLCCCFCSATAAAAASAAAAAHLSSPRHHAHEPHHSHAHTALLHQHVLVHRVGVNDNNDNNDDEPAAPTTATTLASPSPRHVCIEYHSVNTHADLVVDTPHPRFSWQLDDEPAHPRGVTQTAYRLTVRPTQAMSGNEEQLLWDTGVVPSAASLHIPYSGPTLRSDTRYTWTLQYWSSTGATSSIASGTFRTALFNPSVEFQGSWIGSQSVIRMNQLRAEFTLPAGVTVTQATIFYSGIGYSELWLNGVRVDPSRRLDPGWTTFEKRTLYVSFDLTHSLLAGATNCLGIQLGNGWYSQEQYNGGQSEPLYGPPRLLLQLNVQLSNGESLSVVSDNATWTGRQGPLVHDGVYRGEVYDGLAVRDGWSVAGFTDPYSVWIAAAVLPSPLDSDGVLSLQSMDPIRVGADALHVRTSAARTGHDGRIAGVSGAPITQTTLTPIATYSSGEVYVLDVGQNFAGWCRFPLLGSRDFSVHVRYAEVLSQPMANGQSYNAPYLDNLRNAVATDVIITHGAILTNQSYEPTFTVHGFRYIAMLGLQHGVDMNSVQCFPVHSETTLVGNFTTSNAVINQIQHNILWSQISNMMSLPTDCPQRDERKGWMGDAALSVDESLYNYDSAPFYENFLNLISDVQDADGSVTDTVPWSYGDRPADPNWGTAYPTIAWTLYQHYGDLTVLKTHYAGLLAYIGNLRAQYNSTGGGLSKMPYNYGDWVPPPPHTMADSHLVSSYPFLHDVRIVAQIATLLGDNSTATAYNALYADLATEFHSTFYNATSQSYADGFQTSNALALASPGVVPDNVKDAVVKSLVTDIQSNNVHVTTGIVGAAHIFSVLSDNGHHDLALELLSSTSYPSYGWMFNNEWENATTLWELWDAPLDSVGPTMDSRNHIMFGSVGAYFYTHLAGIELNALETIYVHPRMAIEKVHLMDSCQAEVHTIKGAVLVDWSRDDAALASTDVASRTLTIDVTIPHNTRAIVDFDPLARVGAFQSLHDGDAVMWTANEGVQAGVVSGSSGVSAVETLDGGAGGGALLRAHIASGTYQFVAKWL